MHAPLSEKTTQPVVLVPDQRVREELSVSRMTMWRWESDPNLDFPPAIIIRGRKFRNRTLVGSSWNLFQNVR